MTRSMYSTWKIAFDRTWAGPSWISWARRDRSDSWASTIRIWTSAAACPRRRATRLASPRSRKSHVDLEVAQGDLELGELRLLAAELAAERVDLGPEARGRGRPRRRPRRRVAAASGAAIRRDRGPGAVRLPGRPPLDRVELVAERLPASELVGVGGPVALADAPQRVRAVADRLRSPPHGARRSARRVRPGCRRWTGRRPLAPEYTGRVMGRRRGTPGRRRRIVGAEPGSAGPSVDVLEAAMPGPAPRPGPPGQHAVRRRRSR